MNRSKIAFPIFLALLAGVFFQPVQAHVQSGRLTAATDAAAYFHVVCASNRDRVLLEDIIGSPASATFLLKVTLEKNGNSVSVTDTRMGAFNKNKPQTLVEGSGSYDMTVTKVKKKPTQKDALLKGKAAFAIKVHCEDSHLQHDGEDTTILPYTP